MVHNWQRARQTEANRTRVRVWLASKLHWRSAKHLGTRLKLNMHFKPDSSEVWNRRFQISDFKLAVTDFREATKIATNSLASREVIFRRSPTRARVVSRRLLREQSRVLRRIRSETAHDKLFGSLRPRIFRTGQADLQLHDLRSFSAERR